jgi:hypothetical protein
VHLDWCFSHILVYLHSLSCDASVCSAFLIAAVLAYKVTDCIDLETAKDVFWPRGTAIIWWIPLVTDVDVTSSSCTSRTTLSRSSSRTVTTSAASTAKSCAPLATLVLRLREENTSRA